MIPLVVLMMPETLWITANIISQWKIPILGGQGSQAVGEPHKGKIMYIQELALRAKNKST